MPRPRSISEIWGERVNRSLVMRLLCGAWLVPAASLIWIGLATTGIRRTSDASEALALGRTQATAIVLAIFTVLVGASVFVRQSPVIDQRPDGADRLPSTRPLSWAWGHLAGAVVAAPAALLGMAVDDLAPALLPLAALTGFWAGLVVPRALLRHPGSWSEPLAALAVGISFQLTVGWLHLAHPSATGSPLLVAEGLILAWAAASAARVDPFSPTLAPALAPVDAVPTEVVAVPTGAPAFRSSPAQPSLPEAAVGR